MAEKCFEQATCSSIKMKISFLFSKTYDFLMTLDDISVARVNKSLELLETYGEHARYPHTKHLRDGVFELRIIGVKHIRIFFIFKNREAIILHAVIKKTDKLPRKDIEYAVALKRRLR